MEYSVLEGANILSETLDQWLEFRKNSFQIFELEARMELLSEGGTRGNYKCS